MNGSGDPLSSPVQAAVTRRILDSASDELPVVVEYHYERRIAVEVERNSKGYRWHIDVAAEDAAVVQNLVEHLDSWLSARFGE